MSEERLQKILARAGVASRRKAEELIREGRVTVNGRPAAIGDKADLARDSVKLDERRIQAPATHRYLLLNKPRGVMSTVSDPAGRTTVIDLVPPAMRRALAPVGRLDFQTEGLLLLTDDGDLAQHVAHPSFGCWKTYEVKVRGRPAADQIERLRAGIVLEGRRTAPCRITALRRSSKTTPAALRRARAGGGQGVPGRRGRPRSAPESDNASWWSVELGEGRTRQIREMFQRIGHPVQKLRRIAIGPVSDPDLPVGSLRELSEREVAALRRAGPPAARQASGAGREETRRGRPPGAEREETRRGQPPGAEREESRRGRQPGAEREESRRGRQPGAEMEETRRGRQPGAKREETRRGQPPGAEREETRWGRQPGAEREESKRGRQPGAAERRAEAWEHPPESPLPDPRSGGGHAAGGASPAGLRQPRGGRAAARGPRADLRGRAAVPGPRTGRGGRAASPGPQAGRGGRAASPGSKAGRGDRAVSPGPKAGRGGRAASPGPKAGRGRRAASPGPRPADRPRDAASPGPRRAGRGRGAVSPAPRRASRREGAPGPRTGRGRGAAGGPRRRPGGRGRPAGPGGRRRG
jgi:pseudouridine synthase